MEFRINIYPGSASFAYGEHGADRKPPQENVALSVDPLARHREAPGEWLNVWDRIGASNVSLQTLLKPSTFKIIGEHLWNLILDNEIGKELKANCGRR